jgi:ribosomal-protein-alanine N-acetyltransferase
MTGRPISPIELKVVTQSDADDLIRCNIENIDHHRPWVEPFTDEAGFREYLSGLGLGDKVGLIARERATGDVAGVLNLGQIFHKGFQNAYLGYYGMKACAGRGLMTEAVRLTVAYAFRELALHRVEANIQPDNHSSVALVRRVGFRKEGFSPHYLQVGGTWRDHERWALLADEFVG